MAKKKYPHGSWLKVRPTEELATWGKLREWRWSQPHSVPVYKSDSRDKWMEKLEVLVSSACDSYAPTPLWVDDGEPTFALLPAHGAVVVELIGKREQVRPKDRFSRLGVLVGFEKVLVTSGETNWKEHAKRRQALTMEAEQVVDRLYGEFHKC